jgi:RNA polymerase sigma-70 factor (ECF subfamily)
MPIHKSITQGIGPERDSLEREPGVWESRDDEALMGFVRQGNAHAFAVLVERHHMRFYRLAYRYVADGGTAEDIVQDAFLKLWQHPDNWDPQRNSRFTTWFYRVVINLSLDWKRRKKPEPLFEDTALSAEEGAEDEKIAAQEKQQALEREIAQLPERQRTALNLCFYEELSNREAAEIMGLSEKALQSLIMRAKTALKRKLSSYV